MINYIKTYKDIKTIQKSGLFDTKYYLFTYPEVRKTDGDPITHYIQSGSHEGRNPNSEFNTVFYLNQYPDVLQSGMNPFLHYILYGKEKGRAQNKNEFNKQLIEQSRKFDANYYLNEYLDLKEANIDPIEHYLVYGAKEGRNPNPEFHTAFYLHQYPDVLQSNINPLLHYILYGEKEGRAKNQNEFHKLLIQQSGAFDTKYYLNVYPEIQKANIDPIEHFMLYGFKEGRNPSETFNTKSYIARYNISKNVNPLIHFITYGKEIGLKTSPSNYLPISVVPYYFDETKTTKEFHLDENIAIHIDVTNINNFKTIVQRLVSFEKFDLFLSVKDTIQIEKLKEYLHLCKNNIGQIFSKSYTGSSIDLETMITHYGNHLLQYKYLGHFHTYHITTSYINLVLDLKGHNSDTILNLLQKDAKLIYPDIEISSQITDPMGWDGNFLKAKLLLEKYTTIDINTFKIIPTPQTSLFWAKSKSIKDFLTLGKKATQLSEFLKQLLLIYSAKHTEKVYRIQVGNTLKDYSYYEEQQDYSSSIKKKNIKVLSYYLGQFHPIPENDKWHGKGFTEWTNVKRTNPLFEGHYQQHIPHNDIEYYILDNPDILKKQAEMMKKSGVYGQIFYHYWFTGKLILEKPAQMLLQYKDIDMPFCFCWANENWTRRWDGEDDDVLLGQIYSEDDAREFIKYLIPFFQDNRYIKIKNRPVLYIYRSTSIPNLKQYIKIWIEECKKVSIPSPYLVTVLTRGATNPNDFGMDAGVERILFDWTDGAVPNISPSLNGYKQLTGSILDYSKVANFYEQQTDKKAFTYFRSISPTWDNTARYQEGAYALHKSTPKRFQDWFENLIDYTEKNLSTDEQFIVVNAWNEWAEGAHLEPDTYYGYSYLNSIGRALSNIDYNEMKTDVNLHVKSKICITMSLDAQNELNNDNSLKKQFMSCLSKSSIFKKDFLFYSEVTLIVDAQKTIQFGEKNDNDLLIHFQNISLFDSNAISDMLDMSLQYQDSIIISNTYGDSSVYTVTENNSIDAAALYKASIHIRTKPNSKNVRINLSSRCFLAYASDQTLNDVTTIIRFHKSGNLYELKNALFCLCAMQNVKVTISISAQDIDNTTKEKLNNLIKELPLKDTNDVNITYYTSFNGNGDLRTKMLNESLLNTKTRYVAFLDYDDILFPTAYSYMLMRLKETKKSVSFGRVYYTHYISEKNLITKRKKGFEYGYTYDDFIDHNHAPIHSFILDLKGLDLSKLIYHEDQHYMEDYYLTLQLFTQDNADWEGLSDNVYIGDYMHCIDRDQTLAIHYNEERYKLLCDDQYKKDADRIKILKEKKRKEGHL